MTEQRKGILRAGLVAGLTLYFAVGFWFALGIAITLCEVLWVLIGSPEGEKI